MAGAAPSPRRASVSRRLIALLGAFAFVLQALVAQTHVHEWAGPEAEQLAFSVEAPAPDDSVPVPDHKAKCPICQQGHTGGKFVPLSAAVLALPFWLNLSLVIYAEPAIAFAALAHHWFSRAPPEA